MKLPKRIADILRRKQEFIDAQRSRLESSVVRLQSDLFNSIISEIIPELDIIDGVIQDTAKNYRLISVLDKTYKDFQKLTSATVLPEFIGTTIKISELTTNYFEIALEGNLPARFESIIEKTAKLTDLRLGLDKGKAVRGGYLDSFFNSNTIGLDLKQMTSKAVTSNMDKKEYIKMLRDKIVGTDASAGSLERQFQRYAYDIYQQYDASYNLTLGNEFGFNYFIYQGGLMRDSRDFCAAHNNKVWTRDEAAEWATWTPSQGEYPAGYEVKAKDLYSVPSYMAYIGYDPLIDRGGYNCRHSIGWISDELASDMRKDLK